MLDSECQPEWRHYEGREGKGRNELIDINGCGFDGGSGGKDEKAEKITHKMSCCQMKGCKDRRF